MTNRACTRTGCRDKAVATLTYVYAEQTVVIGPLSPERAPGAYDLCRGHAQLLQAPRGWQVIRLPDAADGPPPPSSDDLLALADAVREVGLRHDEVAPPSARERARAADEPGADVVVLAERRHLRVIADPQQGLSRH